MLKEENDRYVIDWNKLEQTTEIAVRFLDDVIDVSEFPLQQINEMVKGNRKIGLGIMGWADMLSKLEIPYNSEEAIDLASIVMKFIKDFATDYSYNLAKERGTYPNCRPEDFQVRNATITTIAPTGTISIIADVSSGIEPVFSLAYNRYSESMNENLPVVNNILIEKLKKRGLYSEELIQKIVENNGSVQGIQEIPNDLQKIFVTAPEISPEWHIRMQAAFQNNGVDSAVSKTINMPNSATIEDVKNAYMLAWKLKCKGITVYRDGSRDNQVLSTISTSQNNQTQSQYVPVKKALPVAYGKRLKVKTGCGSIWLSFFLDEEGKLAEIFTQTSGGGCKANTETISRLSSLLLRANVDPEVLIDQLSSAFCKHSYDKIQCKSCGDVIAKEIKKFLNEINNEKKKIEITNIEDSTPVEITKGNNSCPECGSELTMAEGCMTCNHCGYSKCS